MIEKLDASIVLRFNEILIIVCLPLIYNNDINFIQTIKKLN